ncbi:hypothetical protein FN846DRAFT_938355 [Sphaerosporella brunnea]|uniref:Uncharacterized protein n=1 Tax=Sphaerosporella brunnea TaxID=1250544 RepID=A0A5J5F2V0_9PEZI|nr:hypothetical protein FN846DRAFT_938355 [Sphaerosporella brunnea]
MSSKALRPRRALQPEDLHFTQAVTFCGVFVMCSRVVEGAVCAPAGFLGLESGFQVCDRTILHRDDSCSKIGELDTGVGEFGAERGEFAVVSVVVGVHGVVGSRAFDRSSIGAWTPQGVLSTPAFLLCGFHSLRRHRGTQEGFSRAIQIPNQVFERQFRAIGTDIPAVEAVEVGSKGSKSKVVAVAV